MIPEWALNIFMDSFILERDEAIQQLRKQEQAKNMATDFDIDFD